MIGFYYEVARERKFTLKMKPNSTAKSSIKSGNLKHIPHSKSFLKEHEKERTCFAYHNNLRKRENSKQILLFLSEINTLLTARRRRAVLAGGSV